MRHWKCLLFGHKMRGPTGWRLLDIVVWSASGQTHDVEMVCSRCGRNEIVEWERV